MTGLVNNAESHPLKLYRSPKSTLPQEQNIMETRYHGYGADIDSQLPNEAKQGKHKVGSAHDQLIGDVVLPSLHDLMEKKSNKDLRANDIQKSLGATNKELCLTAVVITPAVTTQDCTLFLSTDRGASS
ncbi:hypothetical protein J6590_057581 [Homalodisca vitripennis]|nr:hypothetical protein J6590_057581 [Homalodisca vitripennis]